MLDAKVGDELINWSTLDPENWGAFKCIDGPFHKEIVIGNTDSSSPAGHLYFLDFLGSEIWWRKNGVYTLVRNGAPYQDYIDKGDSGHTTDIPDVRIIAGFNVGPGGGADLIDRYGNVYVSFGGSKGPKGLLTGGVFMGEGYVGKGNLFNALGGGYFPYITDEEELKKAVSGAAASVGGSFVSGMQLNWNFCPEDIFNCYGGVFYTVGAQVGIGAGGGVTVQLGKNSSYAWDWMLYLPGPTRTEVWTRVLASFANEQCSECSVNH